MTAPAPERSLQAAPSLTRRVTRGFASTAGLQAVGAAIQFASVIILARLLAPSDFGIFAMAAAVVGILDIIRDAGLYVVAVQAKNLSSCQRDNLFWLNAALGAALALAFAAAAPLIALLYDETALTAVVLVLAPTFLFNGIQTQYRASLARDLQFGYLAIAGLVTAAVSIGAGILGAYLGLGYWSLVIQSLVNTVLGLALIVGRARWLPGRYQRGHGTRALLNKGVGYLGSGILSAFSTHSADMIIGRVLGAELLGFYNRSTRIVSTPIRQLQEPANQVILPALARVKDDDAKVARVLTIQQLVACLPILPIAMAIAAHPEAFVGLLLGESWTGVATVTALIAAASLVASVASPISTVLAAKGLVRELFVLNLISFIVNTAAVLIAVWWGLTAVGAALLVSSALTRPIIFGMAARRTDIDIRPAVANALRLLICAAVCFAVTSAGVRLIPHEGHLVGCILAGALALASTALMLAVPSLRSDVRELVGLVRSMR